MIKKFFSILLSISASCKSMYPYHIMTLHSDSICRAVLANNEVRVRILIKEAQDKDALNSEGYNPLYYAIINSNHVMLELLLKSSFNPCVVFADGNTPLHYAALMNNIPALIKLINAGADCEACNLRRQTPLHLAAQIGSDEIAVSLLSENINPNPIDHAGNTPLDLATSCNKALSLNSILDAGGVASTSTAENPYGRLLDEALDNGCNDVVLSLLSAGSFLSSRGKVLLKSIQSFTHSVALLNDENSLDDFINQILSNQVDSTQFHAILGQSLMLLLGQSKTDKALSLLRYMTEQGINSQSYLELALRRAIVRNDYTVFDLILPLLSFTETQPALMSKRALLLNLALKHSRQQMACEILAAGNPSSLSLGNDFMCAAHMINHDAMEALLNAGASTIHYEECMSEENRKKVSPKGEALYAHFQKRLNLCKQVSLESRDPASFLSRMSADIHACMLRRFLLTSGISSVDN